MSTTIERLQRLYAMPSAPVEEAYRLELTSIAESADTLPTADERIMWLLTSARIAIQVNELDKVVDLLIAAEEVIEESQLYGYNAEVTRIRAEQKRRSGLGEEAFQLFLKAHAAAELNKDVLILARTSQSLGVFYANAGDLEQAIPYLKQCIDFAQQGLVGKVNEAQAHLILAQAQLERGALHEAAYHASQAIDGFNAHGSPNGAASSGLLLASIRLESGDIGGATDELRTLSSQSLTAPQRISFLNLTAKLNRLQGEIGEALSHHDEAIALSEKIDNQRLKTNSIQLKCETLLTIGLVDEATWWIENIANSNPQSYDLLSLHELRGKALEAMGQYKEALEEQKKFAALQKELLSERASNALSRLRAAQEVLQAEREAAHFRERSQFYAKELSQRTSYLVQQNEFVNGVIKQIDELSYKKPEASSTLREVRKQLRQLPAASFDWNEYLRLFDEIHPNALTVLHQRYPDLSKVEARICSLVLANMSNIEISNLLGITSKTVENHRYRLRKKLGLSTETDLTTFLESIVAKPEPAK